MLNKRPRLFHGSARLTMSRMACMLVLLIGFAVFHSTVVLARADSPHVTIRAEVRNRQLQVWLTVQNNADHVLHDVVTTFTVGDREVRGTARPQMAPGESFAESLALPASGLANGRWPYFLVIEYGDPSGRRLIAQRPSIVTVGTPAPAAVFVRKLSAKAHGNSIDVSATLENAGATAITATVTITPSHGPRAAGESVNVQLGPGAKQTITTKIANPDQPSGDQARVFLVAQYDTDAGHQATLDSVATEPTKDSTPSADGIPATWLAAAALAAVWTSASVLHRLAVLPHGTRSAIHGTRPGIRLLLDVSAVAVATTFIASHFPLHLLLSPTTTNGGDMGSHVYAAHFLRDALLPQGQVTGWCPGSYCGYPIFQFYFFLPFVLMAALTSLGHLSVAFKIVSVLGTFLLPTGAYVALHLARVPFPGPGLAALATLPFLFMEANSMWGGNIPSTLSGEFSYSLGMTIAVVFVGSLRQLVTTKRGIVRNSILVALTGFAHGYALLWAGFTSLAELVSTQNWWRKFGTLFSVHGIAFLVMAFWVLPMIAYSPWTTAYGHVWFIESWREVLPPVLQPVAILAVATSAGIAIRCLMRRQPFPRSLATIWWSAITGAVLYVAAPGLGLVDIRFLPFAQLALCLLSAAGLGLMLRGALAPEVWLVIGMLVVPSFVRGHIGFIPAWIQWNYSGFESKDGWPAFQQVMDRIRGSYQDPRVVFEHSPDHEAVGTTRAFENIPLFAGRSTLEGVYMQGSPTAPFVFYLQSEVSAVPSCPFPEWGCSHLDLDQAVEHMRLLNVSEYIVRSPQAKAAAALAPDLEHEATVAPYELYRVRSSSSDGYAVPLAARPILVHTADWKPLAYRWFKRAKVDDVLPVFATEVPPGADEAFADVVTDLPTEFRRLPYDRLPDLSWEMGRDWIAVRGCIPGHPVLIRISYHPRWTALTGEDVWLAGPSFMLVFPRASEVRLAFTDAPLMRVARTLSWIGWLVVALGTLPTTRRAWPILRDRCEKHVSWVGKTVRFADSLTRWPIARRRLLLGAALAVIALGAVAVGVRARAGDADSLYRHGQRLYDAKQFADALALFREAQRVSPLSNTAIHATYYEAVIHLSLEQWQDALACFETLIDRFPEAAATAEARYQIGVCRTHLNDVDGALSAWQELQRVHPNSPWAKRAGEQIAGLER